MAKDILDELAGMRSIGVTDEQRQRHREALLKKTAEYLANPDNKIYQAKIGERSVEVENMQFNNSKRKNARLLKKKLEQEIEDEEEY